MSCLHPNTWIVVAPSHLHLAVCPVSVMCNTLCEGSGLLGFEVQKLGLQSCAWEWRGSQKATEVWCHMTEQHPCCPGTW